MRGDKIRRVIIIGAGTMGRHTAALLQDEEVDVVLIDNDRVSLHDAAERFDLQTLHGNGANPEILEQAGVENAQLLLAFTDSCEVNLIAAFNARQMAPKIRTVVRSRSAWTMDTSRINLRERLGIDEILNPELLTAVEIVKFLDNPDALAMNHYAQGKVQLRQFSLDPKSPFCGSALRDCRVPQDALVVMCARGNEVVIPKGDHVLQPGDRLTLIGLPGRIDEAQRMFHAPSEPLRNVTIAGGGNSGRFLAQTLESRNFNVKLIEPDPDRCEFLSERLVHTTILRGDVTSAGFLREERIDTSDVFIALTGDDEDNFMACLLAKELGVKQTVARINRPDYTSLVQKAGIDLAVSPRHVMGDRVMTMVLGGKIQAVSLLEEGKVQVIEFLAESGAPIVGRPLSDLPIPQGVLISAIARHGHVIVPRGDSRIRPADRVIVVGLSERMDDVEDLFHAA